MGKKTVNENEAPSSVKKEGSYGFVGFSIFDFIHIIVAVTVLVYAYIRKGHVMEMDAACSSVELCFAFLLTMFVTSMVKVSGQAAKLRRNFGFCCIIAALAVFAPSTFWLPELVHGDWGASEEVPLLVLVGLNAIFGLGAVVLFGMGQIADEKTEGGSQWRVLVFAGNILFIIAAISGVVTVIMEGKFPVWLTVIDAIGKAAPLVPGAIIFWRLSRRAELTDLY